MDQREHEAAIAAAQMRHIILFIISSGDPNALTVPAEMH
jgi:hypothetical protein